MKSLFSLLLACLFTFLSGITWSQTYFSSPDKKYGLDPLLYNGIKYTYFLPPGTGGHQYLQSFDYFTGTVTIKEEIFEGLTLNYDVYNQQLLLRYADEKGAFNIIQVSKAWLKEFQLGEKYFTYFDLGDGLKFYQILGAGQVKLVYYWFKNLNLDVGSSGNFTFTPAMRSAYVLKEKQLIPFRNKRGFIKILRKENKKEIKRYMRKNRVKLKKASDREMTDLINYISNL
jgi:hypothetical protein